VKRLFGLLALALVLGTVAGLPLARGASTADVEISGTSFVPRDVQVRPGDTVRWTNDGGGHNVHFDDGQFQQPAMPSTAWTTVSRTFATAGTYRYVCDAHGAFGMTGTVTVGDPQPSPTPSVTPTPTPPPPPPPSGGGGAPVPTPELRSARLLRDHFCTRRSRTCKKPGVVLAIDLTAPAAVRGTLKHAALRGRARYRAFGSVSFGQVAAGRRQLVFSRTQAGRLLTPGRYRLALEAAGSTRSLSFRVRPS
jgi:plastocyanin